jgi:hypothetical protein
MSTSSSEESSESSSSTGAGRRILRGVDAEDSGAGEERAEEEGGVGAL